MLLRACDCPYTPCFHNPGKEHEAAKKKLIAFKERFDSMSYWQKLLHSRAIARDKKAILAELNRTDWRKAKGPASYRGANQ